MKIIIFVLTLFWSACCIANNRRYRVDRSDKRSAISPAAKENESPVADQASEARPFQTDTITCPFTCPYTNIGGQAIRQFWLNNIVLADSCACAIQRKDVHDGLASAIRSETIRSKHIPSAYRLEISKQVLPQPRQHTTHVFMDYEVLGPFPIGKLEVWNFVVYCCAPKYTISLMRILLSRE